MPKVCWFFDTATGCRRGKNCSFLHQDIILGFKKNVSTSDMGDAIVAKLELQK